MKSPYGSHPITEEQGYELFMWWLAKHAFNLRLSAHLLGVTHRTAQSWVARKQVPINVAVALDQIRNGPVVQANISRGIWVVRREWRHSVQRMYDDATRQGRLF